MHIRHGGQIRHNRTPRAERFSPVQAIYAVLRYVKYAIAGALGAMVIAQTAGQIFGFQPTDMVILISALVGAGALVVAAKAVDLLW